MRDPKHPPLLSLFVGRYANNLYRCRRGMERVTCNADTDSYLIREAVNQSGLLMRIQMSSVGRGSR